MLPDGANHGERFALLTPVVKAWSTELAQEITSLGVQVHGGMGYIEETGAAQHYRDARITSIYEGTNGIQAQDLVGRKVIRDDGKAIGDLIGDIRQTTAGLSGADADQAVIKRALDDATGKLEQATGWLLDNCRDDYNAPGSVAINFLMLTGYVCGGWQMARAALVATEKSSASDGDFYRNKITHGQVLRRTLPAPEQRALLVHPGGQRVDHGIGRGAVLTRYCAIMRN